jgi:hypothetical protein
VGSEVDEQQRAALERERPVDLARFAWPAWTNWALWVAVGIAFVALIIPFQAGDKFVALWFVVCGGVWLHAWLRVLRMSRGLDLIENDALRGRLSVVVRMRSGRYYRTTWNNWNERRTATLTVGNGWVTLGSERWPAGSVTMGPPPSWFMYRGIELHTPSGSRFVTSVRLGDPARSLAVLLDRRLRDALGRAIAAQYGGMAAALNPAGWYPDPSGSSAWRWWDGQQWGPLSTQ